MSFEEIEERLTYYSNSDIQEFIINHLGEWAWKQYQEDVQTLETISLTYNIVFNEIKLKAAYIHRLFDYKHLQDDRKDFLNDVVNKFRN